ncbi:hypothetical protein D3C86_1795660 [compost metagenome]
MGVVIDAGFCAKQAHIRRRHSSRYPRAGRPGLAEFHLHFVIVLVPQGKPTAGDRVGASVNGLETGMSRPGRNKG